MPRKYRFLALAFVPVMTYAVVPADYDRDKIAFYCLGGSANFAKAGYMLAIEGTPLENGLAIMNAQAKSLAFEQGVDTQSPSYRAMMFVTGFMAAYGYYSKEAKIPPTFPRI